MQLQFFWFATKLSVLSGVGFGPPHEDFRTMPLHWCCCSCCSILLCLSQPSLSSKIVRFTRSRSSLQCPQFIATRWCSRMWMSVRLCCSQIFRVLRCCPLLLGAVAAARGHFRGKFVVMQNPFWPSVNSLARARHSASSAGKLLLGGFI